MVKKILVYSIASAILLSIVALTLYFDRFYQQVTAHTTEREIEEQAEHEEASAIVQLTGEQIKKMGIEIRPADAGQLRLSLDAHGKVILHPDRVAHILPKLAGVVREAKKNVGDFVKVGELLAILESREVAEAKAHYLEALSKEKLAWSLLEREKKLYERGVSPEQDYLNVQAAYHEMMITTQLAKHKLYALGIDEQEMNHLLNQDYSSLRFYPIRAPIDGTILMRHLTQGEFVESATTIYEMADLRTVWVEIGIYPKDFFKVRQGQQVTISSPVENRKAIGRLIYLSPIIKDETIMTKAIAELDNKDGYWYPGSLVSINIATEVIPVTLSVPCEAIQNIEGENCVFAFTSQGFEKKKVEVGRRDLYHVEILAGLDSGELYATNKTFLLKAELMKNSVEDED